MYHMEFWIYVLSMYRFFVRWLLLLNSSARYGARASFFTGHLNDLAPSPLLTVRGVLLDLDSRSSVKLTHDGPATRHNRSSDGCKNSEIHFNFVQLHSYENFSEQMRHTATQTLKPVQVAFWTAKMHLMLSVTIILRWAYPQRAWLATSAKAGGEKNYRVNGVRRT